MSFFNYPLSLRFKLLALSPQIIVTDAAEREVLYVHQKVFNIREDIRVFSDQTRAQEIFRINTERILDLNSKYKFTNQTTGQYLGHVRPKSLRSIWQLTYLIYDENDVIEHHIKEDNPWVKILDSLIGQIEFIGMLTGFFLNPSYTAYRGQTREDVASPVLHIKKKPGFFEGVFTIDLMNPIDPDEEARLVLASMLMLQFMRRRG